MTERPILFSTPMVRAILAGKKTQTRRVVKACKDLNFGCLLKPHELAGEINAGDYSNSKYGQPGDRLWVRETWDFLPDSGPDEPNTAMIRYWAGGDVQRRFVPGGFNPIIYGIERKRPSIHMPRWASRINLEITGVRIEKLQDITQDDAKAEGVEQMGVCPGLGLYRNYLDPMTGFIRPDDAYSSLWNLINGPGAWDANPWVWVIEFRRLGGAQ